MTDSRRRGALVIISGLILTAAAVSPPAAAAPAASPPAAPASTVMLATGESIQVTSVAGRTRVVQRADSTPVTVVHAGARTLLVPREALGYLGRLDLSLFDATALTAHQTRMPVVLTGSASAVPGVTITSRSGSTAHGYITPQSAPRLGDALRSHSSLSGVQRLALDVAPPVTPDFPQVTLDIKVLSAKGVEPDGTLLLVVNTDDQRKANLTFGLAGNDQRVSVPKGHYSLMAFSVTIAPSGKSGTVRFGFTPSLTVVADGQQAVVDTRGATRTAYPTFRTPRPSVLAFRDLDYEIADDRGAFAAGVDNPDFGDGSSVVLAPAATSGPHGTLRSVTYSAQPGTGSVEKYRYYVSVAHPNAVVPDEKVTVAPSSLATVEVHSYTDGRSLDSSGSRFVAYPYFEPPGFISADLPDTPVRTEYLGTGSGMRWYSDNEQYARDGSSARAMIGLARAFPAGRTTREDLFRGPLAPAAISQPGLGFPDCQACRSASQLLLGLSNYGDTDPLHFGQLYSDDPPELRVTVARDGTQVFASNDVLYALHPALIKVPVGDHGYSIVAVHDGTVAGQKQSTHSRIEWRFRSSATSGAAAPSSWTCGTAGRNGCTVLPMLTISDPLPTTPRGTLPSGSNSRVVVTAAPLVGATGTRATALSYGVAVDGHAFVPQAVRSLGGGRFLVTVHTPRAAAGTGISVRVHAISSDGGSIDQTVQTAYVVAGS